MSKNKQILLELLKGGKSQSLIASIYHVSKRDVSKASKIIKAHNLEAEVVSEMDSDAIDEIFFGKGIKEVNKAYLQPDLELYVERKKKQNKLPLKLFWFEYCELAKDKQKLAYSYQSFCEKFSDKATKMDAIRHFKHNPGEKAYIDWAGLCGYICDKILGQKQKVYVFVMVLPYSGYFYVCGFCNMKKQNWLEAHMQAFEEFGGVPRMLIPDNCATATNRGSVYKTSINKDYKHFAQYYATAIVPARVRSPRDKSLAESTVNLVEEWIIAPSREQTFYTLQDFNEFCKDKAAWLNERNFSHKDYSRQILLEQEEQAYLLPLPNKRYELCEWKRSKVAPNYHISIDYMHYSVPYTLIGQSVDVCVSADKISIFYNNKNIVTHKRLHGRKNQYATLAKHMPANHKDINSPWSKDRFISWAKKIGPETCEAISRLLASYDIVEQAFISCRNVLGLSKRYGSQALESACKKVNSIHISVSYSSVKNTILAMEKKDYIDENETNNLIEDSKKIVGHTRGADAYKHLGGRRDVR